MPYSRRTLGVVAALTSMFCLNASSLSAPSLYDVLMQYMDERKVQWDAPDGYRDRNVTKVICPIITPELLERVRKEHPSIIETGLTDYAAGLPVGTRYWHIKRNLDWLGFEVQTLLITTNDGFCHAAYSHQGYL